MVRQIDKSLYKYWEEYFMKSTPHIKPMNDVEIAETVLLPAWVQVWVCHLLAFTLMN